MTISKTYKSVGIQVQPRKLAQGGWVADVTLNHNRARLMTCGSYNPSTKYETREEAERGGYEYGCRVIEEREN
jgi:hypothetical protein